MHIDHWMNFGTFAEQRYFVYPTPETYNGVIINGNMAAYAPDGLSQFMLEKIKNRNYLIDPITHAFQHDINHLTTINSTTKKRELKRSIKTLASSYEKPISDIAGVRPLRPQDLDNGDTLHNFVQNCISFQNDVLSKPMVDSDTNKKYLNFTETQLKPYALLAPYFYLDDITFNDWFPIQLEMINISLSIKGENKLFAPITISKSLLVDDSYIKKLIDEYSRLNPDGYLIWISEYDEITASLKELTALRSLCKSLNLNHDKEIINKHGGYFSILLSGVLGENYLTGVSHGPEYGESRSVIPVGGGIPFAKYYVPHLHQRVKFKIAQRIFNEKGYLQSPETFFQNVCKCNTCDNVIEDSADNFIRFGITKTKEFNRRTGPVRIDYPTTETKKLCLQHYLEKKAIEFQFSATASRNQILDDLDNGISEFEDIFGITELSYLKKWLSVFSK